MLRKSTLEEMAFTFFFSKSHSHHFTLQVNKPPQSPWELNHDSCTQGSDTFRSYLYTSRNNHAGGNYACSSTTTMTWKFWFTHESHFDNQIQSKDLSVSYPSLQIKSTVFSPFLLCLSCMAESCFCGMIMLYAWLCAGKGTIFEDFPILKIQNADF